MVCIVGMADSIDFVDKDDVGCVFFGLFEYVLYMWSIYVDKYFDKVWIGDWEEGYIGFVSDSMC